MNYLSGPNEKSSFTRLLQPVFYLKYSDFVNTMAEIRRTTACALTNSSEGHSSSTEGQGRRHNREQGSSTRGHASSSGGRGHCNSSRGYGGGFQDLSDSDDSSQDKPAEFDAPCSNHSGCGRLSCGGGSSRGHSRGGGGSSRGGRSNLIVPNGVHSLHKKNVGLDADDFCSLREPGPQLPEDMSVSALSLFELYFDDTVLMRLLDSTLAYASSRSQTK